MKEIDIQIDYEDGKYIVKRNNIPLLSFTDSEVFLINDDLVVTSKNAINIYQNIKQGLLSTSIISKQGIVLAKPMLYDETIIVVFKQGIVQFDTNLNVVKRFFCVIDGIVSQERIDDGYFIFSLTKDSLCENIKYDIENNIIDHERLNCDIMLLRS